MIKQQKSNPNPGKPPKPSNNSPPPEPPEAPSSLQSSFKEIKKVVCKYYTLIRILVLLPLSVISRIGGIYFLVKIATSSSERFDSWWKVLSLIGYIFYFTVGSILFFFIAPELEIEVGRKEKSVGYFGGIFGELKALVFRNRYRLPQTNLQSQEKSNKTKTKQKQQNKKSAVEEQNKSSIIILEDINPKIKKNDREDKKYFIEIKKQSSIQKVKRKYEQNKKIRQMQLQILKMKQKQQQNQKKLQEYSLENSAKTEQQLQKLKKYHQTNQQNLNSQKYQLEEQQQLKQDEQNQKNSLNKLLKLEQQIKTYQQYLNTPYRYRHAEQQKMFKQYSYGRSIKLKQQYEDDEVIQEYMDRQLRFLGWEIDLILRKCKFNLSGFEQLYDIILQETFQYHILVNQLPFLPQNQKEQLVSHILLKKHLKQLNTIQVKQKKFYLFLFNLLNATDAMIAWYDYYQLPDSQKFEKFESSYFFLILCFEQIPQIIAQGCSLSYVYENTFNVAIFGISVLKLVVCTLLKLYNAYTTENTETETQKQNRQHEQRIKKYQSMRKNLKSYKLFYQVVPMSAICYCLCYPCTFILSNILPIVNRILLYVFLNQVRQSDPLVFWIGVICLVYYFIVGNSLAIIAYRVPEDDQKKYHEVVFTCVPEKAIKWVISLIIVGLNLLNGCLFSTLAQKLAEYLRTHDQTISDTFLAFYFKYTYIYLVFEGIPYLIIYSLAISRSKAEERGFNIAILCLLAVNVMFSICWFVFLKRVFYKSRVQDEVLETVIKDRKTIAK